MAYFARKIARQRKEKGLPNIDQQTGKRIPSAAEEQSPYGKAKSKE